MSKKLKIAVFHNLPASGALKALQDNVGILKNEGHHIDVYTLDTSDDSFAPLKEFSDNYYVYPVKRSKFRKFILGLLGKIIPSLHFNEKSRALIRFNDFKKVQKKMAEDIDSQDYDFVFLEQDPMFTITPAIFEYLKTLKIYYCPQPYRGEEKIISLLTGEKNKPFYSKIHYKLFEERYKKLDVEYAQYSDYTLCNSYFTHENLLRSYGINSQVSYLGIDENLFHVQNIPRKNIVMSVGGVSPYKGFDFIIRSISKIDKEIRPKFIIVGYASVGSWLNYLKDLANNLDVELEILSGISYDELVKLYNEVKLVIFAPYLEAFGLVPLEAFACGTPVIGVKEGGVKETVKHMETGLLLDRNEFAFAEGITELLTNDELWAKFSNNGPNYIDNFWTLKHAKERLLNNIYKILDEENKK